MPLPDTQRERPLSWIKLWISAFEQLQNTWYNGWINNKMMTNSRWTTWMDDRWIFETSQSENAKLAHLHQGLWDASAEQSTDQSYEFNLQCHSLCNICLNKKIFCMWNLKTLNALVQINPLCFFPMLWKLKYIGGYYSSFLWFTVCLIA